MPKLPLLSKNAYLTIYVSNDSIYSHLAYSHYDIDRSYILKDKSFLSKNLENFDDDSLYNYWDSFFSSLEKKWSWDIFNDSGVFEGQSVKSLVPFVGEGAGVIGCTVKILKSTRNYKEVFTSLRKFSLDFKIVSVDKVEDEKIVSNIVSHLGYDDILYLDLGFTLFRMNRAIVSNEEMKDLSKASKINYEYRSTKIHWQDNKALIQLVKGAKYNAFLSKYLASSFISNIWANFLENPVDISDSEVLQDFIRSYITIQLLSLYNDNPDVSDGFGELGKKRLLWLTGDLITVPLIRQLLISIIDGLQLKGSFDVCFDSSSLINTFGHSFAMGINAKDIIFTKGNFLPNLIKVVIPHIPLKGDKRKVVFSGKLVKGESSENVYAMSSELTQVLLLKPEESKVMGDFLEGVSFDHGEKNFDFVPVGDDGVVFDRVIFDCRYKPVIYGPGAKDNSVKFNAWLSGESYS